MAVRCSLSPSRSGTRTIRIKSYLNGKRTWHGGQTERNCTNLQISRIISLVKAFIVENTFNDIIMEIKNVSIKNYPILDACCGGRMFYFDKHDSRVLFQDIRDVEKRCVTEGISRSNRTYRRILPICHTRTAASQWLCSTLRI